MVECWPRCIRPWVQSRKKVKEKEKKNKVRAKTKDLAPNTMYKTCVHVSDRPSPMSVNYLSALTQPPTKALT
jgi:hypothetical protein